MKEKLTLEKAKALAVQELGTCEGIRALNAPGGWFHMDLGKMEVNIYLVWPVDSDLVALELWKGKAGARGVMIRQFFQLDTLEEDLDAEEKDEKNEKQSSIREWVEDNGVKKCLEMVDRIHKELME